MQDQGISITVALTGMWPFVVLLAAAVSLPLCLGLLRLYRASVLKGMAASAGSAAQETSSARAASPESALAIALLAPLQAGRPPIVQSAVRAPWRSAAVYAAGGVAYAVVMTAGWLWATRQEHVGWGKFALLFWIYVWPAVLAVVLVAAYDGRDGRDFFKDHPVGAGPFRLAHYDKRSRIALERNPMWYGARHPEWKAPGAVYPAEGEAGDAAAGRLDPAYVGRPLPFLDRVEFRIEKEDIPTFNKFLQGYYDASGIIRESFDEMVHEGGLSPELQALGMRLEKGVDPDVIYVGFNMDDAVVGAAAGARSRALRQAMSLAVDSVEFCRVFANGRCVPAQSPIPPAIFGYDPEYRNPYRQPDLERARELLREAGYADGTDPGTGRPLRLSLDVGDPSSRMRMHYLFFVNAWKRLGLDVEIAGTDFNEFQAKMRRGAHQIVMAAWLADYPDPENFLFLLWGPMSEAKSGGPNTANFGDPRFDALFLEMRDRPNDARRLELIREMRAILEHERPWIELFHSERYALYHAWMRNVKPAGLSLPTAKYADVDPALRKRLREDWNRPVVWPAWALGAAVVALVVPGVATFLRERQ